MRQKYSVLLLSLIFTVYTQCDKHNDSQCVTYTPSGIIRGTYSTTRLGRKFETYRGIRYAEPPVGNLRFQAPQLIQKYSGSVDATEEGPVCPQATTAGPLKIMDEDCLRINIYTPLKKERINILPVVVFIHQGAFFTSAARSDIYGPNYLLDRNIVLVTFNYRLGSLGFISTGDEIAPGNNGLKDQVIALRWVQRNINAFGGDPNSVTLTGYSAGSTSIVGHLVSSMSKGLFHRAIAMSGSPTTLGKTPTDLYKYAVLQAKFVNCPTDNSTVIIECLRIKHWKEIAKTYNDFFIFDKHPHHLWQPVLENDFGQERFLTIDPIEAIKDGNMNNVPFIISQNEAEYFPYALPILSNDTLLREFNENWDRMAPIAFLLPEENITRALSELRGAYIQNRPLRYDEESIERLGTLFGDSVVAYPVNRFANLMCRHSRKPVWYLHFTYVGNFSYYSDPETGKPNRAVHQDETLYLFQQPYKFPGIGISGGDALTVDRLTAIWYNFVKYGFYIPNEVSRGSRLSAMESQSSPNVLFLRTLTYSGGFFGHIFATNITNTIGIVRNLLFEDPNHQEGIPELKGLIWPAMTPDNRTYLQLSKELTLHQNLKEKRLQIWEQLYPIQY